MNNMIKAGLLTLYALVIFSQEPGIRKSVMDDKTGQVFDNFRSDSTRTVFRQVLKSGEFIYDAPKNNADPKYKLDKDTFAEIVEHPDNDSFIKVRVIDKFHGLVEGWVRDTTLHPQNFYGISFTEYKELPKGTDDEIKINPHWVKNDNTVAWSDSTLSDNSAAVLKTGDIVYISEFAEFYVKAYFKHNDIMMNAYFEKNDLTPLALIPDPETDISALFDIYDPTILKNDINKAAFVSYSGIHFTNTVTEEYTEDKVCRKRGGDSLLYRYSLSNDINNIQRSIDIKGDKNLLRIAMYRFLPDEKVVTRMDTVNCKVLKFVEVPKTAKIITGGIEQGGITNKVTKLLLIRIEKFDMDVVFHRETTEYNWNYKKDPETGKILSSDTVIDKRVKRLIAFRKHTPGKSYGR